MPVPALASFLVSAWCRFGFAAKRLVRTAKKDTSKIGYIRHSWAIAMKISNNLKMGHYVSM